MILVVVTVHTVATYHMQIGVFFFQLAQDTDGNWRMSASKADGSESVITAKHVISSAPMRELSARIHPLPQSSFQADNLKYRDFLTVALMIKSEDLFPDNWIYIPVSYTHLTLPTICSV